MSRGSNIQTDPAPTGLAKQIESEIGFAHDHGFLVQAFHDGINQRFEHIHGTLVAQGGIAMQMMAISPIGGPACLSFFMSGTPSWGVRTNRPGGCRRYREGGSRM